MSTVLAPIWLAPAATDRPAEPPPTMQMSASSLLGMIVPAGRGGERRRSSRPEIAHMGEPASGANNAL